MAGPAEVSFPGDKNRRKKVRVRGIKQASKQIQERLEKDLDSLIEDPLVFLPEIKVGLGKPRRDMMAASLKEINYVAAKRHDRRWLAKRMVKRRAKNNILDKKKNNSVVKTEKSEVVKN